MQQAEQSPPAPAVAPPAVVAQMPGGYDLSAYGSWSDTAGLRPGLVSAGCGRAGRPIRDGQWAYIAPWGWTWVDAAPWGFAPFHYGRWVQVGGRWGWTPGVVGVQRTAGLCAGAGGLLRHRRRGRHRGGACLRLDRLGPARAARGLPSMVPRLGQLPAQGQPARGHQLHGDQQPQRHHQQLSSTAARRWWCRRRDGGIAPGAPGARSMSIRKPWQRRGR